MTFPSLAITQANGNSPSCLEVLEGSMQRAIMAASIVSVVVRSTTRILFYGVVWVCWGDCPGGKERCSSPLRAKEQLGLPAWHFTTACIEAGFRACKKGRPAP